MPLRWAGGSTNCWNVRSFFNPALGFEPVSSGLGLWVLNPRLYWLSHLHTRTHTHTYTLTHNIYYHVHILVTCVRVYSKLALPDFDARVTDCYQHYHNNIRVWCVVKMLVVIL